MVKHNVQSIMLPGTVQAEWMVAIIIAIATIMGKIHKTLK